MPDGNGAVPIDPSAIKGVQIMTPPASIMATATKLATEAAKALPANASGGLFPIVTTKGANLAFVQRVGESDIFQVTCWIGKTWGEPIEAGAAAVISWK